VVGDKHRGAEVSYGTLSTFGPSAFWQTECTGYRQGCTERKYPILRLRFFFRTQPDWVLVEGYDKKERRVLDQKVLEMIKNTLGIDPKGTV
jgi:hypothetical protein